MTTVRVVARRALVSLPLLLIVSSVTFLLAALTPGDVTQTILGNNGTPEQRAQLRHALGLDQPLVQRYWNWLTGAVHGHFGASLFDGNAVSSLLSSRIGVTLSLVIATTFVAAVAGIALGTGGALRGGLLGKSIDLASLLGLALPNFWLGLMLISFFAVSVKLFPVSGYVSFGESPWNWFRSLVLPVLTLAAPGTAIIARQTRDAMRDALGQPFISTLRAAGVSQRSLVFRHALRNAAIPVTTVVGLIFIGALGGSVIVENVFALPGLGGAAVQAANSHDVPVIQGVAITFTILVIAVNLLLDLLYVWLDPRVRTT